MRKFYKYFPVILILALGTFIRIKTTLPLMTFTPDEAYQTYYAATIIKNFHILWIGMSAGSFGLFLGPFWLYIISPFLSFSHGDPVMLGYLGSLVGVLSIALLYYLGLKMFNKKVALIASLLYACLPLIVYYDQKPYPTGVAFLSILMTLSLYMTKKSKYWWLVFSASFGAVFHIHLSLLPIFLVAIYWLLTHKKTIDKKTFILSTLIFISVISPLIMFDYFHKGTNIGAAFEAAKSVLTGQSKSNIPYHLQNLKDSFGRIWYLPANKNSTDEILWPCTFTPSSTYSKPSLITPLITVSILIYFLLKNFKNKSEEKKLLSALSFAFLVPFIFSSLTNPIEYYLLGFFPILFLITAVVVESFKKPFRQILYILVLIFCTLGIITILSAKTDYGLLEKQKMISKVMEVIGKDSYSLYEEGDCHKYEGWRYLFATYARIPTQSSDDSLYGWLYPDELSSKETKYKVIIKETRSASPLSLGYKFKLQEGGFTAYVYTSFTYIFDKNSQQ